MRFKTVRKFAKGLVGTKKWDHLYNIYAKNCINRHNKFIKNDNWLLGEGLLPALDDRLQILRCDGNRNSWGAVGVSYSQCGQDRFVSRLFNEKTDGVFLDIGGNHPIKINNTYYLEQQGWTGLAFEPLEFCCDEWADQRKTPCLNIALGSQNKTVEFTQFGKDYLSHKSEITKGASARATNDSNNLEESTVIRKFAVRQRILNEVLEEYNIHEIDYCSMDVEGCELDILESIDYSKNIIKCFTIENADDLETKLRIRKFMREKGYWYIARLTFDDVFVLKDCFFIK